VHRFKSAYLIHGDDHGRIAERRARLRVLAEDAAGAQGVEVLEGDRATPDAAAAALTAMTFAIGHRFIVVDGTERWKDRELDGLKASMTPVPPDTTVAFFAREDGKLRAPSRLHELVRAADGDVSAENAVKPWELPKWVSERAAELGVELDRNAARALVDHVGDRQQRLLRELEKLALEFGDRQSIGPVEIDELTAASAERRGWTLADALLGSDEAAAIALYLALRAQGERVTSLHYWMTQRVRTALEVAQALDRGEPASQIKRGLRMPSRAAERLIADARRAGSDRLRRALEQLADLEVASRGGGPGAASEDTAMLLAIDRIAGDGAPSD
jgi:DNA polymerase III subunit delta